MKSLKRAALGGESFFVSTYTAPESGGFVDIAARLPGDITTHEVSPGHALFVQKGSWLANEVNVTIDAQWGGFKNLFGGEGGFIIRTEGQGMVVFACYGALEVWNLQARPVDHHRHRAHGRLRGHGADGDAQGQRWRPGAELQEWRGVRVRLHRARAGCGRRHATQPS